VEQAQVQVPSMTGREHDIDWRQAVRDVVWIPAPYRSATLPAAAARRALRCTENSFAQLVDLGLPHVEGPDGPLYDPDDLKNVGLYSRSQVTEVEMGMRLMLAFMRTTRQELIQPRRWRYRLQLISKAEAGGRLLRRVYRPMPEIWGGELETYTSSVGPPPEVSGPFFRMSQGTEVDGTLTTRGTEQAVRSIAIRKIVDEFLDSGVRWHHLPPAFSASPEEPVSLGAGNCGALCGVLQQRLVDAGFEARSYHGWMIAVSEVAHGWVDVVDEDGAVKCIDPSFALLAGQNGFGSSDFRDFVIGSTLNRVVPSRAPLNGPFVEGAGGQDDTVTFVCRAEAGGDKDKTRGRGRRWSRERS